MSMTRDEFDLYIKNKEFGIILAEMNKPNSELNAHRLQLWFKAAYFDSINPDSCIEFLKYLDSAPQKTVKIPDDLVNFFSSVIEDKSAKLEHHYYRVGQLLKFFLNELATRPSFNLIGNYLSSFSKVLLGHETHHLILKIIDKMEESDRVSIYKHLLDLYVVTPDILYVASLGDKNIFDNLRSVTTDENKKWFLYAIEPIFKSGDRGRAIQIYNFMREFDNNNIEFKYSNPDELSEILKLKRISTQSDVVINKLRVLLKDDHDSLARLEKLVASKNELALLDFTNQISKFLNGFGKLKLNEGLLTCAQTMSRKKYSYDPVVLDDYDEFEKFLKIAKEGVKPNRIKFIISASHWITGDLQIDADGHAKLAIFDSLGTTERKKMHFLQSTTLDVMEKFDKAFPSDPIYFCRVKRQNASKGCSVFALDDAAHLFNIETHLQSNLFDYFDGQPKTVNEVKINNTEKLVLRHCDMPLSLMRTTQSRTTIDEVAKRSSEATLTQPVNKNGDRFLPQIDSFFKPITPASDKKQNTRLEYELEKMAKQAAAYLLTHDKETIESQKAHFRLDAFEKRMAKASKVKPIPS